MSEQQRNRRGRGIDLSNVPNPFAPIQRFQQQISPKGVAAFVQTYLNPPETKNQNAKGTRQLITTQGSGFTTESQVSPSRNRRGVQIHDLAVDRTKNQQPGGTAFQPPTIKGETPQGRALRQARALATLGRGLDQVPVGSEVRGEFYGLDGQAARRDQFFSRGTNDLMKGNERGFFGATRTGQGTWTRQDGQEIKFDPNQLKSNLAQQAVKGVMSLVGGPYVQGAMQANSIVEGMTGKNIGQHHIEGVASMREAGAKHLQQQQRDPFEPSKLDKYLEGVFANPAPWDTTNPSGLDRLF